MNVFIIKYLGGKWSSGFPKFRLQFDRERCDFISGSAGFVCGYKKQVCGEKLFVFAGK